MARRLRVTLLAACITWGAFLIASDLVGIPSKDASELELSREIPPSTLAEGFKMPELSLETLPGSSASIGCPRSFCSTMDGPYDDSIGHGPQTSIEPFKSWTSSFRPFCRGA